MANSNNAIAIVLLVLTAGGSTAEAHALLDHASPDVGSTVSTSPDSVTLYFTDALDPKSSGAEVRNSNGDKVDGGSSASGNTLHASVKNLSPGSYTVKWHVLSADTHKSQGSFSFRVGP
ncbi:copper resistance CopC family protein [Hyphomicrobium sp.]|uniref:copper resistance CopC family protein n=1 Tax=Hyphomicrobium sp. TaxID=82 RepID=UPI001D8F62BC|nr:copper resistance CopC family protein [Hyphomicrobium sp.]MBY0558963.1 copper resistance protein CopC [Hyphomicrobium sp.]